MKIQLTFKDKVICEVDDHDISDSFVIGRSSSCDMVTPFEDTMVSSKHALLYHKRKELWIKDNDSTNHTYIDNKPIANARLRPGVEVIIGHCILTVHDKAELQPDKQTPARLVVSSGSARGQEVIIDAHDVHIGTADDCELRLADRAVSKQHALVRMRSDGSCWICDQNSLNGTFINGDRLASATERMLRVGDEIELGGIILQYYPAGSEVNSFHLSKIFTLVTVIICVFTGSYWGYKYWMYPSAEKLLDKAKQAAAEQNFDVANICLKKAEFSYDYVQYESIITHLETTIFPQWRNTIYLWNSAKESMLARDDVASMKTLSSLANLPASAWTWNNEAPVFRNQSSAAFELLQCREIIRRYGNNVDIPIEALRKALARSSVIIASQKAWPDFLQYYASDLANLHGAYSNCLDDWERVISSAHALRWEQSGLDPQLSILDQLITRHENAWHSSNAVASVLQQRAGLRQALALLRSRYEQLLAVLNLIKSNHFLEAQDNAKQFLAQFANEGTVKFSAWPSFLAINDQLKLSAENALGSLTAYQQKQKEVKQKFDKWGYLLSDKGGFADSVTMCKLISAKCLSLPFSQRHDTTFHNFLCIDAFYGFVKGYEKSFPDDTAIASCVNLVVVTLDFIHHFDGSIKNDSAIWLQNLVREHLDYYRLHVLEQRDKIVAMYLDGYDQATGAQRIIAGGIVMAFSSTQSKSELQPRLAACREGTSQALRLLDTELAKLDAEYAYATPQRQIEIIHEIMKIGVPGHPIVRKYWPKRDALY